MGLGISRRQCWSNSEGSNRNGVSDNDGESDVDVDVEAQGQWVFGNCI